MIQNRKELLIYQMGLLPFRGHQQGGVMHQQELYAVQQREMYMGKNDTSITSAWWGLTGWKPDLQRRTWSFWEKS